jgi:hypothetical protein
MDVVLVLNFDSEHAAILGLDLSENSQYFMCPFFQQHSRGLIKKDDLGIDCKLKHLYNFYITKTAVCLVSCPLNGERDLLV